MKGPALQVHVEVAQADVRMCGDHRGSGFSIWTEQWIPSTFKVPVGSQAQPFGGFLVFRCTAGHRLFRGKLLTRYDLVGTLPPDDQSEIPEFSLAGSLIEPEGFSLQRK